jgi:hypothetical protein
MEYKEYTEADLEKLGFEKRTNLNPRPVNRRDYGWTNTSFFLYVWEDGSLEFWYPGGNIVTKNIHVIEKLAKSIAEIREMLRQES